MCFFVKNGKSVKTRKISYYFVLEYRNRFSFDQIQLFQNDWIAVWNHSRSQNFRVIRVGYLIISSTQYRGGKRREFRI